MAYAHKRLTDLGVTLPNSTAAIFTQPSDKKTYIRLIVLHNANTTTEAVVLYAVPDTAGSAGTAGVTNEIYKESIEAGGTRLIDYPAQGFELEDAGETIQGVTTTASKVTISIHGGQE